MAKKQISSLSVRLGATVAPFTKAFAGAQNTVGRFTSSIGRAGSALLKFTGIAGGLGAVLGGAGISVGIKRQLDAVDAATKFADRIGISTEALSGLQHAAELTGVQANQLNMGLQRMTRRVATAAQGSGEAVKALAELGLSAQALASMSPDEQFRRIADAMEGVENQSDRVRLSFALFDSEGVGLVNTMKGGSAAIDELVGEAGRLGLTFNRVDAAKIEEANDAITRMQSVGVGVFRSLAVAVAPFLTQAAATITEFGARVSATFQRFVPIALGWIGQLWSGVSTVFSAISGFVMPIVTAIGGFIVRNWQTALAGTISYGMGIWNAVSAVFSAVWEIVSTIGSGLVSAWTWAMGMLGFSTETTGVTVSGAFQSIFDAAAWLQKQVTTAFHTMAYVIRKWRDTLDLAVINAALGIVRFANQTIHFFGTVIPDLLAWFGRNWKQVFTDWFNFAATFWTNMYKNVTGFFKSVWSWLKGDGFDWQWTGLTEGFESTLEELPRIAERKIGPLEASLAEQSAILGKRFSQGLGDYLAEQETAAESATKGIVTAVAGIGSQLQAPQMEAITAPDSPIQTMTDQIEGIGAAAKATSDQLQALFSGSAESQRARFAARFNAGQGSTAAAPVPASATRAMRENAGQENVMKQLLELIRTGTNRTLEDIRDGVRDGGLAVAGDI